MIAFLVLLALLGGLTVAFVLSVAVAQIATTVLYDPEDS